MTAILSTKLYMPPPRAKAVARPRLSAHLNDLLRPGHKLAIICAPAGCGKTTLLASWFAHLGLQAGGWGLETAPPASSLQPPTLRLAWLSLDADDNDTARFWSYLITSLEGACPGIADAVLPLLQAPQPVPIATVLTALLNALAQLDADACLVLDDYHQIETASIHEALHFLIEHMPPRMRVIIASRTDPPLPQARLRVRGELVELRAADLRFLSDEAAAFLNDTMDLPLPADDIAALEARTEGWIAGLHLAALALRGRADAGGFIRAFTGSHRFVLDYLAEEVLERLPAHLLNFVLQTAILDRLCGPLCDAVLGLEARDLRLQAASPNFKPQASSLSDSYSQLLLNQLESMNLFLVPLDDERRWYRYHHLFGEVLRERLLRGVSRAKVAELHRRASLWYAHNRLVAEAISHALASEQPEAAADLIEQSGHALISRGEIISLARWLRMLPESVLQQRPRLLLLMASVLPNSGALADVARYLTDVEALLSRDPDPVLRSDYLATQLAPLIYQEHTSEVITLGHEALEHLPFEHFYHSLSGVIIGLALLRESRLDEAAALLAQASAEARAKQELFFAVPGLAFQAQIAAERGNFARAEALIDEALAACRSPAGILSPIAGMALVELGWLRWWQGRDEEAIRAFEDGLDLCVQLNAAAYFFIDGYTGLAEARLAQGRPDDALRLLALADERVRPFGNTTFHATIADYRAGVWRAQADQAFAAWVREHAAHQGPLLAAREKGYLTLVRGLLDLNQIPLAMGWLDRMSAFAATSGRARREADALALRAVAQLHQGQPQAARATLERALAVAAPIGYARIFLDEAEALAALLLEISRGHSIKAGFAAQVLAAPRRASHSDSTAVSPAARHAGLAEPLSDREIEILRLIEAGHSNQEIADMLVIALGTVKKHINNIYGKLEVQSRTQALVRARDLGIL